MYKTLNPGDKGNCSAMADFYDDCVAIRYRNKNEILDQKEVAMTDKEFLLLIRRAIKRKFIKKEDI